MAENTVRAGFGPVEQEQLAAQLVAIMNAHFKRPTVKEKHRILALASEQIKAEVDLEGVRSIAEAPPK